MALKLSALAALAGQATAFVPAGNLRAAGASAASAVEQRVEAQSQTSYSSASTSTVAAIGITATAAAAVSIASVAKAKRTSRVATQVVGICAPFYEKFDPLNLGNTDAKMQRYAEVEIKHGRVSMIACIGYVLPDVFRFPGNEGNATGLGAFGTLPAEGWLQLIALIGLHELFVKPREGAIHAMDFGLGTELFDPCTPEEKERKQTAERNNGRLAMIAILGLMWQDGTFGKSPGQMLYDEGFWGPPVDWIVKDIPVCSYYSGCALAPTEGRTARHVIIYEDPFPTCPGLPEKKPSPSLPFLKYPEQLRGWTGGEKGFDPLGFSDRLEMYYLREVELKHGRICMLATIGWITTDLGVRFPAETFQNTTTIRAHLDCCLNGYMQPFLGAIGVLEIYLTYVYFQGYTSRIERMPGDFFVGKQFLPKDPEQAEDMKLKELENGRLAMIAFSGIVTQAVACDKIGQPGFPYIADIHNVRWSSDYNGFLGWQYQYPGVFDEDQMALEKQAYWMEYKGTFSFLHDFGLSVNGYMGDGPNAFEPAQHAFKGFNTATEQFGGVF